MGTGLVLVAEQAATQALHALVEGRLVAVVLLGAHEVLSLNVQPYLGAPLEPFGAEDDVRFGRLIGLNTLKTSERLLGMGAQPV